MKKLKEIQEKYKKYNNTYPNMKRKKMIAQSLIQELIRNMKFKQ